MTGPSAERRPYLVLDGYVPRNLEDGWVEPARTYDGVPASDILPTETPWVRLLHPTESARTALVLKRYLAEVVEGDEPERRTGK